MTQYHLTSYISFQLQTLLLLSFALTTSWATTDHDVFNAFIEEHRLTCPVYNTCGIGPKEMGTVDTQGNSEVGTMNGTGKGTVYGTDLGTVNDTKVGTVNGTEVDTINGTDEGTVNDPAVKPQCCGFCSCEPVCEKLGNCCPGYFHNFSEGMQFVDGNRIKCVDLQYISSGSTYKNKDLAWMVSKCPPDVADSRTVELCENPGIDDLLETLIPVADIGTKTNYRNKYCVRCSGLSDSSLLAEWKVEIYNEVYLSVPDDNLLQKIRNDKGNIFYRPPDFVSFDKCMLMDTFSISSCNVSGKWSVYNASLEQACASFIDPFNHTYRNYFCYLCNSPTPPTKQLNGTCLSISEDITGVSPPFLAILDVSEATGHKKVESKLTCSENQFSDMKKGMCRDILCKHENRNMYQGKCVYHEYSNKDCSYSAFLKLTPVNDILFSTDLAIISNGTLLYLMQNIFSRYTRPVEWRVYGEPNAYDIIEYIVVYIVVNTVSDAVQEFIEIDKTNLTVYINSSEVLNVFYVNLGLYDIEYNDNESFVTLYDERDLSYHILPMLYEKYPRNEPCGTGKNIVMNRLTLCPYVAVDIAEMNITIHGDIMMINGGWTNTTDDVLLTRWEYELSGDKIHVCLDTYIDIYNKIQIDEKQFIVDSAEEIGAKQIVSFACVFLSLVCLVLTTFTYLRFRKLQTQPGMNTIILCFSLFLAQALYQFGAGQGSLSDWACALIGALCHFFWLSVMFAMNICSIHMFIIFKKHRLMLPRFRWRTTLKGILYMVGSSLFCVILNIIISAVAMNDNFGGYGGKVCYISSSIMQIVTFLIPTSLTLTVNLLLFAYVVLRISKTSWSSTNLNQERNYFLIYVRLSTLTGLTWIFGFLRLFLNLDVLEYLFIILNAGQGIFIMVAFVFNKRVLSMFFGKGEATVSDKNIPSTEHIKGGNTT